MKDFLTDEQVERKVLENDKRETVVQRQHGDHQRTFR